MNLAERINAYLTPLRRQAMYQILGTIGVLLTALSPTMSTQVSQWTQVIYAVATVASLILASLVTKAAQWPAIYRGIAALVAALVGASVITESQADTALRIVSAALTVIPLVVILARTDVTTPDGSLQTEVIARHALLSEEPAPKATPYARSNPDGSLTVDMADGSPPVTESR